MIPGAFVPGKLCSGLAQHEAGVFAAQQAHRRFLEGRKAVDLLRLFPGDRDQLRIAADRDRTADHFDLAVELIADLAYPCNCSKICGSLIFVSSASITILDRISAVFGSSSINGRKRRPRCWE